MVQASGNSGHHLQIQKILFVELINTHMNYLLFVLKFASCSNSYENSLTDIHFSYKSNHISNFISEDIIIKNYDDIL